MVYRSFERRSLDLALIFLAFFAGLASSVGCAVIFRADYKHLEPPKIEPEPQPEKEPETPEIINFQPIIDEWTQSLNSSAEVGIEMFDLDNNQIVAEKNSDKIFPTESLYKLFVVYEGYRRLEQGIENPNTIITGEKTYEKCLDLAIRESNSACAETIRSKIGASNLENIIKTDFALENSSNISLTSTATDITEIMKIYYSHKDLSEETWQKIQDSMLIQSPVNNGLCSGPCDWRRGLPSGFSSAKVYNKVGWRYGGNHWISYHDTAIVEFPELNRHYIVTVLSSNIKYQDIANLGTMLETKVLSRSKETAS